MDIVAGAVRAPSGEMPVVDLAPWFGNDHGKKLVAQNVLLACREAGFFCIRNHRVPSKIVQDVFGAAHAFFHLDDETKHQVHYERTNRLRGYIPLRGEGGDSGSGDLKEAFDCAPEYGIAPGTDIAAISSSIPYWERQYGRNQWPNGLPQFRMAVEAYLDALVQLGRTMFEVFALSLDLPSDHFSGVVDQPIAEVRLLRYPPQEPVNWQRAIGIHAHCDSECFSIIAQNDVGGLQVRGKTGQWVLVDPIPDTFIVLIGEMLARWTNDTLSATPHRVINIHGGERYSVPFFFGPNYDAAIACLDSCHSPERPIRYRSVVAGEYLSRRLAGDYMDQPRRV